MIAFNRDDVLRLAEAALKRWRAGTPRGPLDGVPVVVKDELDMVPYPTTVGTTFLGKSAAVRDATAVARLRRAGAVLLGKANMHEIGINPTGANNHYGHVANPYALRRDAGGSSSGSAAAVAAGLCPVSVGADGGGSIRVPAALCGVVGLKPTFGRVSEAGAAPLCWSVAHVGPMAATVGDALLAYAIMAGPDLRDPNTGLQPPLARDPDILSPWSSTPISAERAAIRIGIFEPWFEHAEAPIVEACAAAVETLVASGEAERRDIVITHLNAYRVAHVVTILSEMAAFMESHPGCLSSLGPHAQINLRAAHRFTATDYVRAQRARAHAMRQLERVFQTVDVIATPTTAVVAPVIPVVDPADAWSDLSTTTELMRFCYLTNLTGHPSISVPCGYTEDGLPIGLQLIAPHWHEARLFQVAARVETATIRRPPPDYHALG